MPFMAQIKKKKKKKKKYRLFSSLRLWIQSLKLRTGLCPIVQFINDPFELREKEGGRLK